MKKILVLIEDEKSIADILKEQLEERGVEVEVAFNGIVGMKKIKEYDPDLVLLDLILPGENGIEILKEMRESERFKDTPVIILSNVTSSEYVSESMKLGVSDYLIKADHELKDVLNTVDKYLKRD